MRNKYPGQCYRCGELVSVGDGHFERVPKKGWRVQHAKCAIWWRGVKHVDMATAREKYLKEKLYDAR